MPFYEYQCQACGAQVEVLQKISDAPLKKCPECGKSKLVKLVSAPVFRLKGGGWYETDFKSDAEKKRNLVGEDSKPDEKKADEGKAEALKAETPKADSGKAETGPGKPAAAKARPVAKARPAAKTRAAAKPAKPAAKKVAGRKGR